MKYNIRDIWDRLFGGVKKLFKDLDKLSEVSMEWYPQLYTYKSFYTFNSTRFEINDENSRCERIDDLIVEYNYVSNRKDELLSIFANKVCRLVADIIPDLTYEIIEDMILFLSKSRRSINSHLSLKDVVDDYQLRIVKSTPVNVNAWAIELTKEEYDIILQRLTKGGEV